MIYKTIHTVSKQIKKLVKKPVRIFTAICTIAILITGTGGRAYAVDAWAVAAQALGVFGAYNSALQSILAMGNSVHAQVQSRQQDIAEQGQSVNQREIDLVNEVMTQLVEQGDYVIRANSLPFAWEVNASQIFNAACYPTDYITVNSGLIRGLNYDVDQLASVLAHEMVHGLEQHSAKNYAKAVAQYYGFSFLNMNANLMEWDKLNALVDYSIAKNVTLPSEYDADEGGFYIMTSAGFNPGGGAATMARMSYYLTYVTEDIFEYQDPSLKGKNQEDYSDHPDIERRELKLAQMMTDYSAGHVTVANNKDILIDGEKLLSVTWTKREFDNSIENAYYVAGAIAKAFHDHDDIAGWNFRKDNKGNLICLDNSRVNEVLQRFLISERAIGRLYELVARAYENEQVTGARKTLKDNIAKRQADMEEKRAAIIKADADIVKKMRENSDIYSDHGDGKRAMFLIDRVFMADNKDGFGESYAIRARAKAVSGDFAGAISDADYGVELEPNNVYTYLNRADVYRIQGDRERALVDSLKAIEVDVQNVFGYLITAELYHEMDNKEQAREYYTRLYEVDDKAIDRIPDEYLAEIDPKEFNKILKQREKAEKKANKQK